VGRLVMWRRDRGFGRRGSFLVSSWLLHDLPRGGEGGGSVLAKLLERIMRIGRAAAGVNFERDQRGCDCVTLDSASVDRVGVGSCPSRHLVETAEKGAGARVDLLAQPVEVPQRRAGARVDLLAQAVEMTH